MNPETLHELRREFDTSSWAIWSEDFPKTGCIEEDPGELVENIIAKSNQLKPWIVLLGLSRSTGETENYENFHSTDKRHNDDILRLVVEKSGLDGAYMTDVSKVIEKDGSQVELTDDTKGRLLEQLEILGQSEYYVICFGNAAFDHVKALFNGEEHDIGQDITRYSVSEDMADIEFLSVRHYTQYVTKYIVELSFQMEYLGREVIPLGEG